MVAIPCGDSTSEKQNGRWVSVQICVNDETKQIAAGTSVAQLLEQLQLEPRFVAVERNGELVPRARHAVSLLENEDRLEVVTLVGGG
jgi:thiamine biosynthesis protein ThiS